MCNDLLFQTFVRTRTLSLFTKATEYFVSKQCESKPIGDLQHIPSELHVKNAPIIVKSHTNLCVSFSVDLMNSVLPLSEL